MEGGPVKEVCPYNKNAAPNMVILTWYSQLLLGISRIVQRFFFFQEQLSFHCSRQKVLFVQSLMNLKTQNYPTF